MSINTVTRLAALLGWGLALKGTLSIAQLPGHWGHSVCGVWGCGPPLQAIVASHGSWLVLLLPPVLIALQRFSGRTLRISAMTALVLALVGLLGVAVHEYLTWYAGASAWQRTFFGRRVWFVVLTTVEVPLMQVLGLSVLVLIMTPRRHQFRLRNSTQAAAVATHSSEQGDSSEPCPATP